MEFQIILENFRGRGVEKEWKLTGLEEGCATTETTPFPLPEVDRRTVWPSSDDEPHHSEE